MPARGASSAARDVSVTVLTALSLESSGCQTGTTSTSLGPLTPPAVAIATAECELEFGASDATTHLLMHQEDRGGDAMYRSSDGVLDVAFDGDSGSSNGLVQTVIGGGDDYINDLAVQPDGKVVVVGVHEGATFDVAVARYNPDGTLDQTFDGPSGTANGSFTLAVGAGEDVGESVAIQPDGKILIAGHSVAANADPMLLRLTTTGAYDMGFDGASGTANGIIVTPGCGGTESVRELAVQEDGRVVLVGSGSVAADSDFALLRFNPDGRLDATFDGDTGTGNGVVCTNVTGVANDYGFGLDIQPDGTLVTVGSTGSGGSRMIFMRHLANGTLDTSFDGDAGTGNGIVAVNPGGTDYLYNVDVQPDGRIVAAGFTAQATNDGAIVRLEGDGRLDTSFDGDSGSGNGVVIITAGAASDYLSQILVQPDGGLVAAGDFNNAGNYDMLAVRVRSDGRLDTTFDGDGRRSISLGANADGASAALLHRDGSILLAGQTGAGSKNFVVARLIGNPVADFDPGVADWSAGSMFAACLQSAGTATAQWTEAGAGNCTTTNPANWEEVADDSLAGTAQLATATPNATQATVEVVFGMRAATGLKPGAYVAPLVFSVIVP
ncbi:MAG: hypothetical protein JWM25_611 [Thermoleophilia bacterium]|nr:hypothetical protein [Thermoleophilia bacterium]